MLFVLVAGLVGSSSCSFTAVKRIPGNYQPGDELDCTSGLTYPLIDMAGTILSGVLAVNLLSAGTGSEPDSSLTGAGIASGTLALAFGASAIYGTIYANRCRQKRNAAGVGAPLPRRLEDAVPPGSLGGPCLEDGSCDSEFICDRPMQTCIPDPLFDDQAQDLDDDDDDELKPDGDS